MQKKKKKKEKKERKERKEKIRKEKEFTLSQKGSSTVTMTNKFHHA